MNHSFPVLSLALGAWLFLSAASVAAPVAAPSHGSADERLSPDHAGEKKDGHAHGAGGEKHEEEGANEVKLTDAQIKLGEIQTTQVKPGDISSELTFNGIVSLNEERVAEVVPRVPGTVREVRARLGDNVRGGDTLAIIQSRELADTSAEFLAARERMSLAQNRFGREEGLRTKRISSEQEFLEARQAMAEARITLRAAEQKLRALGLSSDELTNLQQRSDDALTRYSVAAPFAGTIIEKHITQGEQVEASTGIFKVAQLDNVWVMASVYPKDIARVAVGQPASVSVQAYPGRTFPGTVTWVSATIDEKTRALPIRVEVDNGERLLKPGLFARVAVGVGVKKSTLVVPPSAIQTQKGETIVFVDEGGGRFTRREVVLGLRSATAVEVAWGVDEDERIVTTGAFLLKSELEKAGFEAGHGH